MLKIVPMTKAEEHERVCLYCKIQYDKTQFAYGAYDDGKVVGAAQFYVKDKTGYISDLRCISDEDCALSVLLGRSVLNFLDLHNVKEAYFEMRGEEYDKIAQSIGFRLKDDKLYANLSGMFDIGAHK